MRDFILHGPSDLMGKDARRWQDEYRRKEEEGAEASPHALGKIARRRYLDVKGFTSGLQSAPRMAVHLDHQRFTRKFTSGHAKKVYKNDVT